MIEGTGANIVTLYGAIGVLFAALMTAMKVRGDDWKELYLASRQELKDEKAEHAAETRENNRVIAELGGSVRDLVRGQQELENQLRDIPKRRADYERTSEGRHQ